MNRLYKKLLILLILSFMAGSCHNFEEPTLNTPQHVQDAEDDEDNSNQENDGDNSEDEGTDDNAEDADEDEGTEDNDDQEDDGSDNDPSDPQADLKKLPADNGGTQTAVPLGTTSANLGHYIYLPGGYASNSYDYPLIVFLHGAGEAVNANGGQPLSSVLKNGPPKIINSGKWNSPYPVIVASPQTPSQYGWNTNEIHEFITYLINTYRINTDRIYLTGLSLGGMATWSYVGGKGSSGYAAAAVPICGRYSTSAAGKFVDFPLWAFHGSADTTIKPNADGGSILMVEAINALNPSLKAKLTIYPGVGHDSWTKTYDGSGMGTESNEYDPFDQSIYQWMFQFKK